MYNINKIMNYEFPTATKQTDFGRKLSAISFIHIVLLYAKRKSHYDVASGMHDSPFHHKRYFVNKRESYDNITTSQLYNLYWITYSRLM